MQEQSPVMTFLLGGAASVTILSALFFLANNYIINKIGLMIRVELHELEIRLEEKYITRDEIRLIEEATKFTHNRQDAEIRQLWNKVGGQ